MTDAISAITQNSNALALGTGTGVTTDLKGNLGKDDFLKLLVAQLKYQDPDKPADSSTFMAQTAQFSLVEKFEEMQKSQADLLTLARSQSATSMVGQKVTWKDGKGTSHSGTVDAVTITAGIPALSVGKESIALDSVTRVEHPSA